MKELFFSVIIPTYKDQIRLITCLEALINQNLPIDQFEVIVVNNDPEGEPTVDDNFYKQLQLTVITELKPGSYAARNLGIKHARGKVLAFTDSDCLPERDWLENAKIHFQKDISKNIGILAGDVHLFYKDVEKLTPTEIFESFTAFRISSQVANGYCVTANWFSYKEIIEEFGGFNSELKSNGDNELSLRIFKKYKIVYGADVVVKHPARHELKDLLNKFRRVTGGTYVRKYKNNSLAFMKHLLDFTFGLIKLATKKLFTISLRKSIPLLQVCGAIIIHVWKEYFSLVFLHAETKR
ncbi:glycosyltransferase [Olivibacter domesticus]|uniref:Glycosyl transferase family 2 n=1 Tax=Olivibacter domesticus TaxID=407022 RepID=A0A1H7YYF7_OLID1|nr:glycosyltransferase [Olivibacter domesticus]SEM51166.1 Glycosyl transferase family 2 [Olivibacter domesticus]